MTGDVKDADKNTFELIFVKKILVYLGADTSFTFVLKIVVKLNASNESINSWLNFYYRNYISIDEFMHFRIKILECKFIYILKNNHQTIRSFVLNNFFPKNNFGQVGRANIRSVKTLTVLY